MRYAWLVAATAALVSTGSGCLAAVGESGPAAADRDAGGSGSDAGSAADAGDAFCTGDSAKILRPQQGTSPVVTTGSLEFLNCCEAVEVLFHTEKALSGAADLSINSGPGGTLPMGATAIGDDPHQPLMASMDIGGTYYGSGLTQAAFKIAGSIELSRADASSPLSARVCLTLNAPGDKNDGVRFFAPAARVMPYSWEKRVEVYLLKDRTLDGVAASGQSLNALVLENSPVLDLFSIRYYSAAENYLAFHMGIPAALKQMGTVPVRGLPFVVVADGARIYLGEFWTHASSNIPTLPYVVVETVTAQGAIVQLGPNLQDPRSDPRLLATLSDAGKLVP